MRLSLVVIPTQAKYNFHPLGEKAKSRESRNKEHPQEFQVVNLWFEGSFRGGKLVVKIASEAAQTRKLAGD
jgi:hypothetical protein